jgi:hypothetical protein
MSPGLGDDERFGLLHVPFAPNCSSPDHAWGERRIRHATRAMW